MSGQSVVHQSIWASTVAHCSCIGTVQRGSFFPNPLKWSTGTRLPALVWRPAPRMTFGLLANSQLGTGMVPRGVCPADLAARTCSERLPLAARCGLLAPIPVIRAPKAALCLLRRMHSSSMERTGRRHLRFVMPASILDSMRSKSSRHQTSGLSVEPASSFLRSDGMARGG